tara:strand:- start:125 stop:787 length:663 start_codon:yes stop_codon:yes gene_type:complete
MSGAGAVLFEHLLDEADRLDKVLILYAVPNAENFYDKYITRGLKKLPNQQNIPHKSTLAIYYKAPTPAPPPPPSPPPSPPPPPPLPPLPPPPPLITMEEIRKQQKIEQQRNKRRKLERGQNNRAAQRGKPKPFLQRGKPKPSLQRQSVEDRRRKNRARAEALALNVRLSQQEYLQRRAKENIARLKQEQKNQEQAAANRRTEIALANIIDLTGDVDDLYN